MNDVAGQPYGTIFERQAVPALLALWQATFQKSEGLKYTVVGA